LSGTNPNASSQIKSFLAGRERAIASPTEFLTEAAMIGGLGQEILTLRKTRRLNELDLSERVIAHERQAPCRMGYGFAARRNRLRRAAGCAAAANRSSGRGLATPSTWR
jgi:hypothetical protein